MYSITFNFCYFIFFKNKKTFFFKFRKIGNKYTKVHDFMHILDILCLQGKCDLHTRTQLFKTLDNSAVVDLRIFTR